MGGEIRRAGPQDDAERQRALDRGYDLDRCWTTTDLVSGENVFFRHRRHRRRPARGVRYLAAAAPPFDGDAVQVRHGPG